MNYGSVCSGVEAASLAWKPLGWTAKFYAEVEPFPAPEAAAPTASPDQLRLQLQRLEALLIASDSEAEDYFNDIRVDLADHLAPADFAALGRAISAFDFDAAQTLCRQALDRLAPDV